MQYKEHGSPALFGDFNDVRLSVHFTSVINHDL
jgi:hypothetical protein